MVWAGLDATKRGKSGRIGLLFTTTAEAPLSLPCPPAMPRDRVRHGISMLSINHLRNIDPELQDLADDELIDIRAKLYALAELALDCWIKEGRQAAPVEPRPETDQHDTLSV